MASSAVSSKPSRTFFSILLPSRNRLDLLRLSVDTILRQDFKEFEIVIADNSSADDYAGYVDSLNDERVRLIRSDSPLHVTENWNRALEASSGAYVIMLGDDDGLTPGYLSRARALLEEFDSPDVLYVMAYQYCYPNTIPGEPAGYLVSVHYDSMGGTDDAPFVLDTKRARLLGREGLRMRHLFGFNSQHFVWKQDYVRRLKPLGPFFQSPYPDFYSSFVTMLTADRIVVDPEPRTIIGVSPKSFGYYFNNDQVDRGNAMLMLDGIAAETMGETSSEIRSALDLPGDSHLRNWFIATLFVRRNLQDTTPVSVDVPRFRRIQIYSALHATIFGRAGGAAVLSKMRELLDPEERKFAATTARIFRNLRKKIPRSDLRHSPVSSERVMRIHTMPRLYRYDLGGHNDIRDVWNALDAAKGNLRRQTVAGKKRSPLRRLLRSLSRPFRKKRTADRNTCELQ